MQGLEAVAQEIGAPMRRELQRVFTEVRLGRAPEDALDDAAERMDSNDLAWTVMAIKIQREVGGNLADAARHGRRHDAEARAHPPRDQRAHRRRPAQRRSSSACCRSSRGVLLFLVAPDYMKTLFDDAIGIAAVDRRAVVLAVVGWFWLRKIIDIEV